MGTACAKTPQTQARTLDFIPMREKTTEGFEQMSENYSDSMVGKIPGCAVKGGIPAISPSDALCNPHPHLTSSMSCHQFPLVADWHTDVSTGNSVLTSILLMPPTPRPP